MQTLLDKKWSVAFYDARLFSLLDGIKCPRLSCNPSFSNRECSYQPREKPWKTFGPAYQPNPSNAIASILGELSCANPMLIILGTFTVQKLSAPSLRGPKKILPPLFDLRKRPKRPGPAGPTFQVPKRHLPPFLRENNSGFRNSGTFNISKNTGPLDTQWGHWLFSHFFSRRQNLFLLRKPEIFVK